MCPIAGIATHFDANESLVRGLLHKGFGISKKSGYVYVPNAPLKMDENLQLTV